MEKVTTAVGVQGKNKEKGNDDGSWRQEWSNTMAQCAGPWRHAVPWQQRASPWRRTGPWRQAGPWQGGPWRQAGPWRQNSERRDGDAGRKVGRWQL